MEQKNNAMIIANKLRMEVILVGIIFGFLTVISKGTALMLGVIFITGIILWHFLPEDDRGFLIKVFIIGISLRVIIFAAFYIISFYRGGYGEIEPDSRLYFLKTLQVMRSLLGKSQLQEQVQPGVGNNGYLLILSIFYLIIGYNPSIPDPASMFPDKLINCLIGTLSAIPIFYISKGLFGKNVAKISSIFAVFYPSFVIWSMTNTREPINILLVSIIILLITRMQKAKKIKYFFLLFFLLLYLLTIRPYIFFCTLIVILSVALVYLFCRIKRNFLMLAAIMLLFVYFINFTSYGQTLKTQYLNPNKISKQLYKRNQDVLSQKGTMYRIYDNNLVTGERLNKMALIKGFLKGYFYFMLVPFPWAVSSGPQLLALPQMIILYFSLPFIFIGIIFSIRYKFKTSFTLLSYVFIVTSAFALVEGNIGSALRHRDLVLPFYFIFASAGLVFFFKPKAIN